MIRLPSILGLIILVHLLLANAADAHIVKQLFFSLEKPGKNWEIKATFDAGYALPEFRDDANAPQPERQWLLSLTEKEQLRLRNETAAYLKDSLRFTFGNGDKEKAPKDQDLDYQISFPDYQSTPPDFPSMLNGGAYITVLIKGTIPSNSANDFSIHIRSGSLPDFVIASGPSDQRSYHVVTPGNSAVLFKTTGSANEVIVPKTSMFGILKMGYRHVIPDGLDHLLFILALFLMARRWKPLVTQSLVFTVAHSITLGLAASGVIQLSRWSGSWLIEPMIALSIAAIAIENIFTSNNSRHRLALIFLFGLVHGLGFAGSLGTALDQGSHTSLAALTALAIANLGVELAQVTILTGAWIATIQWCHSPIYPKFRIAVSAAIALIGIFWMIERTLLAPG